MDFLKKLTLGVVRVTDFINFRDNCNFSINQLVASPCCVDLVRGDWVYVVRCLFLFGIS